MKNFFTGVERVAKDNGDSKEITVGKIGWRRIAKNTCRFGWCYINPNSDSDDIIEPFNKKGKTKVELVFVRADKYAATFKKSVRVLEFFYNLAFLFRRIAAFLLPVLAAVGVVVSIIKRQEGFKAAATFILVDFAVWLACIILEGILARCAASKLKGKAHTDVRKKSGKSAPAPSGSMSRGQDDDDNVVTLISAKGEEIDFVEAADIKYRGNFYAILQPVELLEGMEENEALVFKVSRNAAGEDNFEVETDDKVINAVFIEYNKILDEAKRTAGNLPYLKKEKK